LKSTTRHDGWSKTEESGGDDDEKGEVIKSNCTKTVQKSSLSTHPKISEKEGEGFLDGENLEKIIVEEKTHPKVGESSEKGREKREATTPVNTGRGEDPLLSHSIFNKV